MLDAGVVDEDVDGPDLRGLLHERHAVSIADVQRQRAGDRVAEAARLLRRLFRRLEREVGEPHRVPLRLRGERAKGVRENTVQGGRHRRGTEKGTRKEREE